MPLSRCLLFMLIFLPPALAQGDEASSYNDVRGNGRTQLTSNEQLQRTAEKRRDRSQIHSPFVSIPDQDNAANRVARLGKTESPVHGDSGEVPSSTGNDEENLLTIKPPAPGKGEIVKPQAPSTSGVITTVIGSLAVVLPLFFLLVWVSRKMTPKGSMILPEEVVEQLGRATLNSRQSMHLVRVGRKLLLLSITPSGTETLTEICDPEEVDHLVGLCRQQHPNSISESFKQVLTQFGEQPAPEGFLGDDRTDLELAEM